jgi:2-dehydro-3-deoxyglucarate aldolase/4-hydroxy-2-oxoheptanedioate aldolase
VLGLPCAEIADALSRLSFDWLWLDLEHGNLDVRDAQMLVQAIGNRCAAIVRVPSQDEVWLKKVLDIGIDGIIVPQVKTAEEAQRIVNFCLYPPQGIRGVGIARAQGYGISFQEYMQHANDCTAIILQIEHIDAVNNIHEILAVEGVDAVLIGPYDLSGSLHKLGEVQDPEVINTIQSILHACKQHNLPAGIFCATPGQAAHWQKAGVNLLAIGTDITFLWRGAQQALLDFKTS